MSSDVFKISPSFYGIQLVPEDCWLPYGYALLTIAGSDGVVSEPEMEWLTIDLAGTVGISEDIIGEWEEFDFKDADLREIFKSINVKSFASFNKLIIYDAIRMSYADEEYAEEEKQRVYEAAALLKVGNETVQAIESLIEMERAADKLRMVIL